MRIVVLVVLVAISAAAIAQSRVPEPTVFESFVADPAVIVELEQWIDTLDSSDAKVSVTALVAFRGAEPKQRMRGVRLTMEDNGGSDSVHLEESELPALKRDLADVESGRTHLKSGAEDAPWRVAGTGRCWMPERPVRILCLSYRIGPEGSGLVLAVYGGRGFEFPARKPADLAALIDRAVTALVATPSPEE
ncbi:MAG: hypothetical protein ACT4UQ_08275 [Gammaproteobacteria bacterium]